MKNELEHLKEDIEVLNKNWLLFEKLKTLEEIESFLQSSEVGEVITFIEIEELFEENNIKFNFKKVKAYMQDFFINNTYTKNMKKVFEIDRKMAEEKDSTELFQRSISIKNLIKLYLFQENLAQLEVLKKNKNESIKVDIYIDKLTKDFMVDCFVFIKTFVK
jgi:hypothetical protein